MKSQIQPIPTETIYYMQYDNDRERVRRQTLALTEGRWEGCRIKDMPWVRREIKRGGRTVKTRSVDQMLRILRRRLSKNGRLDDFRDGMYYTKPSDARREESQEREHKLDKVRRAQQNDPWR